MTPNKALQRTRGPSQCNPHSTAPLSQSFHRQASSHAHLMFGLFKKKPDAPAKTGYRAFPPSIQHPSRARRYTASEFAAIRRTKMQDAPPSCPGHAGTTVWYVEREGYIIEVRFDSHPPVYAHSICTFTPTFGMDRIDGEFAQDVEEFVLYEVLGFQSQRLAAFPSSSDIPIEQYLRARGVAK
jgi:hypothetical protein